MGVHRCSHSLIFNPSRSFIGLGTCPPLRRLKIFNHSRSPGSQPMFADLQILTPIEVLLYGSPAAESATSKIFNPSRSFFLWESAAATLLFLTPIEAFLVSAHVGRSIDLKFLTPVEVFFYGLRPGGVRPLENF